MARSTTNRYPGMCSTNHIPRVAAYDSDDCEASGARVSAGLKPRHCDFHASRLAGTNQVLIPCQIVADLGP